MYYFVKLLFLIIAAPIDKSNAIDHRPPPNSNSYQNSAPQRQAMVPGNRLSYGREGEGMPYRNNNPDSQWAYNERAYQSNQQGMYYTRE